MNSLLITVSEAVEVTEQNFQSFKGDDFDLELAFKDEAGVAQNIHEWTIYFTAKQSKELADNAAGVVVKNGTITNEAGGLATITLEAADTEDLLGAYFYDILYKDENGVIKTVATGKLVFLKRVRNAITP